MKLLRRARIRSMAKWTGTVLTALLFLTWIASTRYSASHSWNQRSDSNAPSLKGVELPPFFDLAGPDWIDNYFAYSPSEYRHTAGVAGGRLLLLHDADNGSGWWEPDEPQWSMRVGFDARIARERRGFRPAFFALPLWFPVALIGIPTALLWRRDLRTRGLVRLSLCTHCGYDLAATASTAPCPECGRVRCVNAHGSRGRVRRNLIRGGCILTILLFTAWIGSAYMPRTFKWNIRDPSGVLRASQLESAEDLPKIKPARRPNQSWYEKPPAIWNEIAIGRGQAWIALNNRGWGWEWPQNARVQLWLERWNAPIGTSQRSIAIPLWIPLVLVAIPTALLWRSGRRGQQAARRE